MTVFCFVDSPLGPLTLTAADGRLTGLWLPAQHFSSAALPEAPDAAPFDAARAWLAAYFRGLRPDPASVPLRLAGTPFRLRVWQTLREIPYGHTVPYGALARKLGSSPRAVGGAVGRNPISLLVPCHRVVGANGHLIGYRGGLEKKIKLLSLEGIDPSRFIMP